MRTGVNVIARSDAKSIANVFIYASGLKGLPACACKVKTGRNPTVITYYMHINEMIIETGRVRITTNALGRWNM